MKVYKYCGIQDFDRDLATLLNNQLFASPFIDLNDPFEGICEEKITELTILLNKVFKVDTTDFIQHLNKIRNFKSKLGIYSMSMSNTEEVLWTHYASSHKGFCIEYDLDKLMDLYALNKVVSSVKVEYSETPPTLTHEDINTDNVTRKLFATKTLKWEQEKEIRLIFDTASLKEYPPSALKAIYFGVNTIPEKIKVVIDSLNNRDVSFYRFEIEPQTYNLIPMLIHENKRHIQNKLADGTYEILKTKHLPAVENFYVLYKCPNLDESSVKNFIECFRNIFATKQSNIYLFDSKSIVSSIDRSQLENEEYVSFADHFFAWSTFDGPNYIWWFPYQDDLYAKFGGKNWKKAKNTL